MQRTIKSRSLHSKPLLPPNIRVVDEHLKNLYRLKTQVQQLDIIKVPHKQPPITRQMKQLIDVSSQILKKRSRNQLGTSASAVKNLIHTLGNDPIDNDKGIITSEQLRSKLNQIFEQKHDVEVINNHSGENQINAKQIGNFLTHNQCSDFDPLQQAFQKLDPQGQGYIDYKVLSQLMETLGIDLVSKQTLSKLLGVDNMQGLTYHTFKQIVAKFQSI